jgi:hypothetical protein
VSVTSREPTTITLPVLAGYRPGDELNIRPFGQRQRSMIVERVDSTTLHLRPRTWRDLPHILARRGWRIVNRIAFRVQRYLDQIMDDL